MESFGKNVKISSKKLILISKFIRGKSFDFVLRFLTFENTKAAKILLKLFNSAKANAMVFCRNENIQFNVLDYVVKLNVGRGSNFTRSYLPRAKGRVDSLVGRTSNIRVFLVKKEVKENGK